MTGRRYEFSWDLIGDIEVGRPNLGPNTRLEVYRLMQFTLRDALEQQYGTEKADEIFYQAGYLAGNEFYKHVLGEQCDFNEFIRNLQSILKKMGIGVLKVEKADLEQGSFVLTVSEDLDCSGLPDLEYEICIYDEGFISGLLESFTGKHYRVKEVDCWCTGDRTCRFTAELMD
ncbi:MAG: V4R domain-containing protein [Thermodesulfobacteriota bacterium]